MLSLEEMEQNILAVMNQQAAELSEKAAELNRNEGELRLVQRMKKVRDEEKESDIVMPDIEILRERLSDGMLVTHIFKEAGLVTSEQEARSLIDQGGLSIDGRVVKNPGEMLDLRFFNEDHFTLGRGEHRRRKVVLTEQTDKEKYAVELTG